MQGRYLRSRKRGTLRSRIDSSAQSLSRSYRARRLSRSGQSRLDTSLHSLRQRVSTRLPTYDFLRRDGEEKARGSLLPRASTRWLRAVLGCSLVSLLACVVTLWAPHPFGARRPTATVAETPWSDGCQGGLDSCICPRATTCADDLLSMVFLTAARCTAWFDYPLYMLLFLSKAKNLNNFLQKTTLRCWINFSDFHHVHALFGAVVAIESTSHSFFHLLRWARRQDDLQLLWTTKTGVTGLFALLLTPLITLPMTVPFLKQRMTYEWRKGLHYLSVPWGAALMCHAPERIFWLIGVPLFVYCADKVTEYLFQTHLVESAHFQRLSDTSILVSFENPQGFGRQNSAYIYLMLPWLSTCQFHAFTVIPSAKANHSSIVINEAGDWTRQLMQAVTVPTHRPAFVVGPFLSPFSPVAMDSDHLVAVATGIGVTPVISLVRQYRYTSRRLNLIWICKDPGLVEHFLQSVDFGSDGYTLIYYTGRERDLILRGDLPSNVLTFDSRPDLARCIAGIISSISTGEGLPEELQATVLTHTPAITRAKLLLEKALALYGMDRLHEHAVEASSRRRRGPEPLPAGLVNYEGARSTMQHLLGEDGALLSDKITENLETADVRGSGHLDHDEFEEFFQLMLDKQDPSLAMIKQGLQKMTKCRDLFKSSHSIPEGVSWEDNFGIKRHLQGEGKFAARNWNMLYCGGSQPVLDKLKAFGREFGIGLSVEKFDW